MLSRRKVSHRAVARLQSGDRHATTKALLPIFATKGNTLTKAQPSTGPGSRQKQRINWTHLQTAGCCLTTVAGGGRLLVAGGGAMKNTQLCCKVAFATVFHIPQPPMSLPSAWPPCSLVPALTTHRQQEEGTVAFQVPPPPGRALLPSGLPQAAGWQESWGRSCSTPSWALLPALQPAPKQPLPHSQAHSAGGSMVKVKGRLFPPRFLV